MALWSSLVLGASLVTGGGAVSDADCAVPTNCASESAVCVDQSGCCPLFGDALCSSCDKSCKPSKAFKHSTYDMYPHYPYFPESHGYYYYRPYNWMHIEQHRSALPGVDMKFPYSNAVFEEIAHRFEQSGHRLGEVNSDVIRPRGNQLQDVEEILRSRKK